MFFIKRKFRRRRQAAPSEEPPSTRLLTLIMQKRWKRVIEHVAERPKEAQIVFFVTEAGAISARLALHEACRHKAPLPAVEALVKAFPDAVRCRDTLYNFLPIHFACRYGSAADVVEKLLRDYPSSIRKEDRYGNTPEHIARRNSHSNKDEVISVFRTQSYDSDSSRNSSVMGG